MMESILNWWIGHILILFRILPTQCTLTIMEKVLVWRDALIKFNTLLGACATAGGFSHGLIKWISMNSNAYVCAWLVGNKFYGCDWKNITVEEMFHALGIILKMRLVNILLGGLKAYLNPITKGYITCDNAIDQIQAALYPEDGESNVGDKCHQWHAAIQYFNEHDKKSFIIGDQLSFNEGCITCKSHYNPVHQYNLSNQWSISLIFFVLVNATAGNNFIHHLDVYQGKNVTNAFTAEEAWHLPTTQKAVVNAIAMSGFANEPNGMRET